MNKEDFLNGLCCDVLPVEGLGLYVRALTGKAMLALREKTPDSMSTDAKNATYLIWTVIYSACDRSGKRLFTDEDFDTVADLPLDVLLRIQTAAEPLNKFDVEDAKKN